MKRLLATIFRSVCISGVFSAGLFLAVIFTGNASFSKVLAQSRSYFYDSVNVTMDINQDSSAVITEEVTYHFTGLFHAVTRAITLQDYANEARCKQDNNLQCGGFEYYKLLGVYGNNGEKLDESAYTVQQTDDGSKRQLLIDWEFNGAAGKIFNDESFKFTVKYEVFGSFGYFSDYDLLYWNAVQNTDTVQIHKSVFTVNFPKDLQFQRSNLRVLNANEVFDYDTSFKNKTLTITKENIYPDDNFTVLYKMPKDIIAKTAGLDLQLVPQPQDIKVNDVQLSGVENSLKGIPPGETKLEFSSPGYYPQNLVITLQPGEIKTVKITLTPEPGTIIKQGLLIIFNVLGCLSLPVFLYFLYHLWQTRGKDIGRRQTVIPMYSPPGDMRPYLVGSLKDEEVNLVDITSVIIDCAYRKYLKIHEFKAKTVLGFKVSEPEYELIKLQEFSDLGASEQKILQAMFKDKDRVTTTELQNKFYLEISGIQDQVYQEMVAKKYFSERPDSVRSRYQLAGFGLVVLAVILEFITFSVLLVIGLPLFITLGFSLGIAGIVCILVAGSMPAKTVEGSKALDHILGFRMYMQTAERFRVQDLTPETFEKYLAYAIVFGIEQKWAERFKDIYKQKPDWYESDVSSWNTFYMISALSHFNTATMSAFTSTPQASSTNSRGFSFGSGFGGGWSGGGGFGGGFGGGGGGGGGFGAR